MKKRLFKILDNLRNYIYKERPLYEKTPVLEKNIKNKSLNELIFLKESEHDFLSLNIPIILGLLGAMTLFNNPVWKILFIFMLLIIGVNISVALEEKKQNIRIYNKVILKKMEKQDDLKKKYENEILRYLGNIEKEFHGTKNNN